eukprot:7704269-Pyramimonas_sp.AAC.1
MKYNISAVRSACKPTHLCCDSVCKNAPRIDLTSDRSVSRAPARFIRSRCALERQLSELQLELP